MKNIFTGEDQPSEDQVMPDACEGCKNLMPGSCRVYDRPGVQHRRIGGCPMRTHNKQVKAEDGKFIDPLKASKRAAKGVR